MRAHFVKCFPLSLLPFAPRAPALDNTNNIIWCVTRAWCLPTDRTSALLTKIVLHCERTCETILTKYEHQCASVNIVDNSLKNVYRNVSIYRKCIISITVVKKFKCRGSYISEKIRITGNWEKPTENTPVIRCPIRKPGVKTQWEKTRERITRSNATHFSSED